MVAVARWPPPRPVASGRPGGLRRPWSVESAGADEARASRSPSQSYYALTRPELIDLLRSAERLLTETGDAVALCPVYGDPAAADAPSPASAS